MGGGGANEKSAAEVTGAERVASGGAGVVEVAAGEGEAACDFVEEDFLDAGFLDVDIENLVDVGCRLDRLADRDVVVPDAILVSPTTTSWSRR